MEILQLTRKEMSQLLLCLNGAREDSPLTILREAWSSTHQHAIQNGQSFSAFITTSLSPIFEKLIKADKTERGLSLHDIVALGNQIEYTHFSVTAVQNWVKRDMKEWIGTPRNGKKYSIEQAALLYIIEDLKATLDFESIRKLFSLIFNNPEDHKDDLINPIDLYAAYSSIFEEMDADNDHIVDTAAVQSTGGRAKPMMDSLIQIKARDFADTLTHLNADQKEAIIHTIVIAILSIQSAFFQTLSRRSLNAALFLRNLHS
ncbi:MULTISPECIES: DUF1836 domain-containing protein [Brevibacillus]|uniref:DUF1836 domain-containing protein n=1 Tax=Brevibacillus invocatus TaxID=173959 RepID=A0A3M8CKK4_9BACL|nr:MULTISPECIES: DUF1836 domain-containing protein [Brevibacillus]MCM3078347.1 DUF1836 domain-containing protein [Brevibacillus invocatus]MCM3428498.1 DUF1836 domain-containing protein [Brevibacillus invocatus]MDH4616866.1 DUF1836 domain-containing protein [Brevibacillus sp. AY1]RNB76139.1 DUF1836 domain-containing protein [Brevibacillus invocatus]